MSDTERVDRLVRDNAELRRRLKEAEKALAAARRGALPGVERCGASIDRLEEHGSVCKRAEEEAEERLRRSAETFYRLIQNSPFGVHVVDAEFRLLAAGARSRKAFEGVEPLLGRDFAEAVRAICDEPFASEVIARFRHTLETGEPYSATHTVEAHWDEPTEEAYDWRIERISLPDGRYGVVCHFYDLSARLHYEAAVRDGLERYRLVNLATNDVIWDWDLTTDEVLWNEALQAAFGYDLAQVPKTIEWWCEHIHADDRERVIRGIHDAIDGGHDDWRDEYRFRRADG